MGHPRPFGRDQAEYIWRDQQQDGLGGKLVGQQPSNRSRVEIRSASPIKQEAQQANQGLDNGAEGT